MQPIDRSLVVDSCGDYHADVQNFLRMQHIYNFKKEGVVCMVVDQDASVRAQYNWLICVLCLMGSTSVA
jgi:hypothetical protein